MAFTSTMRRLHLYIFPLFSPLRLTADIVRLVLVLDRSWVQRGTHSRRISLALDRFVCLSDHVHPALFLDEGMLVDRPREVVQVSTQ